MTFTGQRSKIDPVPAPSKFATPAGAIVCPKCGAHARDAASTCTNCGSTLGGPDAETLISSSDSATPDAPTSVSSSSSPSSAATLESSFLPQPQAALSDPSHRAPDFGPRYRVECILGEGGMGTVYKGWDKELERTVALKLVRRDLTHDPNVCQRFKQELLLSSKISHRNVLRIHDLGDGPGDTKFISMAYVEGQDLSRLLRKEGKLPLERALNIARQLCAALDAAHEEGVVHRDLKPQNILIDQHDHIYVSDFGLAKSLESDLGMTRTGQFLGTPRYMSPEQAETKPVDHRSDLYAFGLILCELVTGNLPFERAESTMQMMYQRVHETPKDPKQLNPDLPEYLARIIQKCLERDVTLRYQNAREILADLDAGHASELTHPSWVGVATTAVLRGPRNVWRVAAAALVVLALGLAVWKSPATHSAQPTATVPAGPQVSLAILPFRNASGDPSLDWLGSSLAEMLTTDVGQSASLRTVSPDRLHQILSDLHMTGNTQFDPATLRQISESSNADTVVSGQYVKFGDQIRIDASLQDLKHNRRIPLKIEAAGEKDIPGAVDRLADAVRHNLAVSSDVLEELKASSFQPTSESVPALRDYNRGVQLLRDGKNLEAVRALQAAVKEDPQFALAYSRLADADSALGYDDDAEQDSRKAVDLSQQLPLVEKYLIEAIHARTVKDNKKAVQAYENLSKTLPDNSDVLYALGSLYRDQGDYDKARTVFLKVLQADPKNIKALWQMGAVEIMSGNPQAALDPLNKGLSLAIQVDNQEQKALILLAMGIAYKVLNKPDEALRNYQQSLDINEKIGQKRAMASDLNEMAQMQVLMGKSDSALASYNRALQIRRDIGAKKEVGDTLIDLGNLYLDRGKHEQALKMYKDSLQIQRDSGDENNQALCLNNIGILYLARGDNEDALTYLQQALQLRQKLNIPTAIAETLHNLGIAYANTGQDEEAMSDLMRALDLYRNAGDKSGAGAQSHSLAFIFARQGRYGAAVTAMQDALQPLRDAGDRSLEMAQSLADFAESLAEAGRGSEADKPLDEAQALTRELKNDSLKATILNTKGDVLFYGGDVKGAKEMYQQASRAAAHGQAGASLIAKINLAKAALAEGNSAAVTAEFGHLAQQADALSQRQLSVECSVYLAQAMINNKDYSRARPQLEQSLAKSEKLSLRLESAKIHYLLGTALRLSGNESDATGQYREAVRLLDEIKKDPGADRVLGRSDLHTIYSEATRWAGAAKR